MDQKLILLAIVGMAAVTYIPRVTPIWALASRALPDLAVKWLGYVPTAVLAALLAPSLLLADGALDLSARNVFLWAAAPTLLVAWKTRSFFGAVAVGMGCVAALRLFLA
ncbi:MAG: AzlD domain-containing protein [Desulfovibrionaceae bacterium]